MGIDGINQSLGISVYSNVVEPQVGFSKKLNFIPLYKFLSMALLLLIFVTIFYVALNILISSITKNKIIGFTASGLITLIGTTVSRRWTIGDRYNLSPFTMNNPVMILNGTYNATALMALTVLIVSIIVIYLTNLIYFQRKDL
jgi:ABC-type transport system involved in multi-copper enzyme maturation permease subunit